MDGIAFNGEEIKNVVQSQWCFVFNFQGGRK